MNLIKNFFSGASGHLRAAVLGVIVSALLLRYPSTTSWLGEAIQKDILQLASEIKEWGWGFVLLFVKQYNATGGTIPATDEAEKRTNN